MRHKKRHIIVVVSLLLIAAAVPPLAIWWHRIFPTHEVSELYSRYENVDGVEASFVKDFQVNDTLFVDVTLLQATTDSAWAIFRKEFRLMGYPPENKIGGGKDISYKYIPKNKYNETTDTANILYNDCLAIDYTDRVILVFHIADERTQTAIAQLVFQHMLKRTEFIIN